jgi:hypothetical protein
MNPSSELHTDHRGGGPVRLLVAWEQPGLVSSAEAEVWANEQLVELAGDRAVTNMRVLRLAQPSTEHATSFAWLLEVCLPSRADAARLLSEPPLQAFLCDLRSLRLRRLTLLVHERSWALTDR